MVMNLTRRQDTALGQQRANYQPIARPSVTQELSENVILTTVDDLQLVTAFELVATAVRDCLLLY